MDRARKLTPAEIHTILKLNEEHCSVTKTARTVNRSRKAMESVLKDPDNYEERKSCGRPQLTTRDKRAIIRIALNSSFKTNRRKSWSCDKCWQCSTSFKELRTSETTKIATTTLVKARA